MPSFDASTILGVLSALLGVGVSTYVLARRGESTISGALKRAGLYAALAVLFWLISHLLGVHSPGCGLLAAIAVLVCAIIEADARWMIIPDPLTLTLLAAVLLAPHAPDWFSALVGLSVCGGMFLLVRYMSKLRSGTAGLGLGDVKLAGVIGAALGVQDALAAVGAAAAVTAMWLVLGKSPARRPDREVGGKPAAPFGVGLAMALLAGVSWRALQSGAL